MGAEGLKTVARIIMRDRAMAGAHLAHGGGDKGQCSCHRPGIWRRRCFARSQRYSSGGITKCGCTGMHDALEVASLHTPDRNLTVVDSSSKLMLGL